MRQQRDRALEENLLARLADYRRRIEAARALLVSVDFDAERLERAIDLLTPTSPFDSRPLGQQGELSLSMFVGRVCYSCGFRVVVGRRDRGELAPLVARRCPACGYGRSYEVELCGRTIARGICVHLLPCPLPHELLRKVAPC